MSRALPMFLLALPFFLLWPAASHAEGALGFLYSRSDITITRHTVPEPLPWLNAPPPDPAVRFDVEVRDAAMLYGAKGRLKQDGWFNFTEPAENGGVLMALPKPELMPVSRAPYYVPLDILLVDKEGKIRQIIPNVKLSELEQDILPEAPVLAFLFLKGGAAGKWSIHPGDTVGFALFKKSQVVIGVEEKAKPPAPATPKPTAPLVDGRP